MHCKGCYYSLANRGTAEPRCPECGLRFNPTNVSSYIADVAAYRAKLKRINWAWILMFVVYIALMASLAFLLSHPNGSRFLPVLALVVPFMIGVLTFRNNLRILRKLNEQ